MKRGMITLGTLLTAVGVTTTLIFGTSAYFRTITSQNERDIRGVESLVSGLGQQTVVNETNIINIKDDVQEIKSDVKEILKALNIQYENI